MKQPSRTIKVINALLAKSGSTQNAEVAGLSLDDPAVQTRRKRMGNHLSLRPELQLQWLLQDWEQAQQDCVSGKLQQAALLWKQIKTDAVLRGPFDTRVSGTVSLPRRWRGPQKFVEALELGHESIRSLFDEMCPPEQLKLMVSDFLGLGVALGEMVEVPGRNFPVLKRLDPTFIQYVWSDNNANWYYNAAIGRMPIIPGNGKWVLWTAGDHAEPWIQGMVFPAGRIWIEKTHAILEAINYQRTLANGALIATTPLGANDADRSDWFSALSGWGMNTVLSAPAGYDVRIEQGSGVGYESFDTTVKRCNEELVILVAGQIVSSLGSSGFATSSIYQTVREDLIRSTAESLAYFINTQIIPQWVATNYGSDEIENSPCIYFDTTSPKDPTALAQSWIQVATALPQLEEMLAKYNKELDIDEIINRCNIPIKISSEGKEAPSEADTINIPIDDKGVKAKMWLDVSNAVLNLKQLGTLDLVKVSREFDLPITESENIEIVKLPLTLAPTDLAKVVRVDEARASQGLAPIGDNRGQLTIPELTDLAANSSIPEAAE